MGRRPGDIAQSPVARRVNAAAFCFARDGQGRRMTDQQKQSHDHDDEREDARQEAGEREQGVRSEDSEDESSPQFTERADT